MVNKTHFSPASEKGHFDGLVDEGEYLRQSSLYKQILPRTPSRQIRSLPPYQVGPQNLRNLWLINDLRLCHGLYISRDSSTDAERSLQIEPFLTNKANFRKSQINVNNVFTMGYDIMDTWSRGKNKANTKPIQTQNKANTNPIQSQNKPNSNPKQTQFKPNSKPIQSQFKPNLARHLCGRTNPISKEA